MFVKTQLYARLFTEKTSWRYSIDIRHKNISIIILSYLDLSLLVGSIVFAWTSSVKRCGIKY